MLNIGDENVTECEDEDVSEKCLIPFDGSGDIFAPLTIAIFPASMLWCTIHGGAGKVLCLILPACVSIGVHQISFGETSSQHV